MSDATTRSEAQGTSARVRAYVALGANLGDREATLEAALRELDALPGVRLVARSTLHETEPVGGPPDQPRYLNGVAVLETGLAPRELLSAMLAIEAAHGRTRGAERDAPRVLDLDLLFHGEARSGDGDLVLPHPRLEDRAFVLAPLAELEPGRVLAGCGLTVAERLAQLRGEPADLDGGAIELLRTPAEAAAWCERARRRGTLGFVPTMGALHEGHLELVRRAVAENDAACVSVFVNPLQFNDPRDFERYPRDLESDARMLAREGCAMVFTGTLEGFFPGELDPRSGTLPPGLLRDPGAAAHGLEGEMRPGHFAGVATIVARLFELVRPERAYFGQKDFQQTLVVRDLARAAGAPRVVVCPTSREPSGLARSSRNELLSPDERARATRISAALRAARAAWRAGERAPARLGAVLREALEGGGLVVEYAEVRDPERWTAGVPEGPLTRAVALVAARAGDVRLIDNASLDARTDGVDDAGPEA